MLNSEIGFFGFLGLLFTVFKLAGILEWSWLWVSAPIWIPVVSILALGLVWVALILVTMIILLIHCFLFE